MKLLLSLSLAALALANPIEKRQYVGQNTENQLTDGTPCRAITILFARGTTESGNVGTLAGPPFFQAVVGDVGASKVAVQGVDYAADIAGFDEGGDPAGAATLAGLIKRAQTQCPNTKLVVSGYSQGGQVVHKAALELSASQTAFINSVVIFGDPDDGEPVGSVPSSKVLIICHVGDDICLHGDLILPPHLTYGENAQQAATFVVSKAGL
ncbi:hypothetical protein LTR91_009340 [Friedmanniomyces endolithicus]|uniref:Cutinase n=1 Tax=Friedmanniomyces endolithicus TaxID=329885 RepID=A0A4U0UZ36_9PEZI|nr:hypothetical protein LTS09_001856 [Friedmanniomyces endolithicus]KAK0289899.1 hypothetical protein LTS00_009036 [Friedmanniomyces endolithicus]KAK0308348.1 hypothetical protein LTR01_004975 [Friedmanniomyces endolithicus]KAK0326130.1 hypothetical protein LTR82_002875 [Friedmanniomyces endolithicus]KAK0825178.1 hypothetical protein LTR73_007132 [Friedmanniomyces endolithicus]